MMPLILDLLRLLFQWFLLNLILVSSMVLYCLRSLPMVVSGMRNFDLPMFLLLVNLILYRKLLVIQIGSWLWMKNFRHLCGIVHSTLFLLHMGEMSLIANGSIRLSRSLMALLIGTKPIWLLRVSNRGMALTMKILSVPFLRQPLFAWCLLWLFHKIGNCGN
jgi:hypothetical protein